MSYCSNTQVVYYIWFKQNDLILQFIISILFTISMAHPEALRKKEPEDLTRQDRQVNQEINEPDDLLAVENIISEVIHPPPPPGMKTRQNIRIYSFEVVLHKCQDSKKFKNKIYFRLVCNFKNLISI